MNNSNVKKGNTIRDIAKEAGVSISTVSRVINNPEITSMEMQRKVIPVIEKYGYVPNLLAKNLYSQRSNTIAIFVYDMMNPFFLSVIKSLNRIALLNQFNLIICDTENEKDQELAYFEYCKAIRCNGIVLTEGVNYIDSLIAESSNMDLRIVSLDRKVNDAVPTITSKNISGAITAVGYVLGLGHKKRAFDGLLTEMISVKERHDGYKEALQEADIMYEPSFTYKSDALGTEDGARMFDEYFDKTNKPTAILCANDQIAKGFAFRAYEKGISIPEDCSIIGFDGVRTHDTWPKLTTMRQNIDLISEALFLCVTNEEASCSEIRVETELVIGKTTASLD